MKYITATRAIRTYTDAWTHPLLVKHTPFQKREVCWLLQGLNLVRVTPPTHTSWVTCVIFVFFVIR